VSEGKWRKCVLYNTVGVTGIVGGFHYYTRQHGVLYICMLSAVSLLKLLTMISTPILSWIYACIIQGISHLKHLKI
jgi:hypothetical protein